MRAGMTKNIYKIFSEGRTPDVWICTLCPHVEIRINPEKYYKQNASQRRRALEVKADQHIAKDHAELNED